MHRLLCVTSALALLACDPARAGDPEFAQILGPATNDLAGWKPTECLCGILEIKVTGFVIDCSNQEKTPVFLNLPDLRGLGRVQVEGDRQMGPEGPFLPAFFEAEVGTPTKDVRGPPRTGTWYPLRIYKALLPARTDCADGQTSCQSDTDHTLTDSLFWCDLRGHL